ncbi:PREDICTED: uncharacterized protein LOC108580276 [Habropoda laboriosa]|uniref:uncharacterized protein LOC108580276 n=1 Tax=Habropoda laboriosa TaxID=597456 RepID=UPI00083E26B3|nr:PREDICTED: uncharacterized protein LOC108580276 [Habropoda laboriosa]
MVLKQRRLPDNKEDDDVSVIAVIGKENDQSTMQQPDEKLDEKQERWQVFELSDERSKMALRRQLDLEALSTEQDKVADDYEEMDILQKIPPGTIIIKQERKYKGDSDYVRDSTETSSGGSTSGGGAIKVRKIHRVTRKNRGPTEIRRNPIRVTKKDSDKDFPRPRQRLLSTKQKEMLPYSELSKRGKSSTMPYMNTRSVTRKMYNVGATYQAPTIKDETEWKEWPVHGMHERPVFHPLGLAAEYLGRYFASLDGFSYQEIVDRPDIEVVSVDPHCDFLPSSTEKKRIKKTKPNKGSSNSKNVETTSVESSEKNKSFESCMHESFHYVLGYCSQLMTPTYKTNVEGKISILNNNISKETDKQPSIISIMEQNSKSGQMKIQEMVRPSKSPFILVNPPEMKDAQILKPVTSNANMVKLEDSSTREETLGELPSVFKNDFNEELAVKGAPKRGNKVEFTVKQYFVDNVHQNKVQVGKELNSSEKKLRYDTSGKELNVKTISEGLNKTWCTSEAAEIAKILSEYNKSTLKKPAIENQKFCTSMKNIRVKKLLNKEENVKQNVQKSPVDRNKNITFPQGKWRRFHLTVEKLKDMKSNSNDKRLPSGVQNRQSLFKIDQTSVDNLSDRKVEVSKQLDMVQRAQPSIISLEKKGTTSTMNSDVNAAMVKTQSLQELLENTAMLYCAATGAHQDDLANYVDTLDAVQSIQWLDTCNNYIV